MTETLTICPTCEYPGPCEQFASHPFRSRICAAQHRRTTDRKYLRIGAVYRLLSRGRIGVARAQELLAEKHSPAEMRTLENTLAIWCRHLRIEVMEKRRDDKP
jgi:hypothetical protein